MVFSGIPFLFFFLTVSMLLYYLVPFRMKNYVLLAVSLVFYAWGEPIYILLMVFSTFVSWLSGLLLAKYPSHRKLYLVVSVTVHLALLGFFKYANLFLSTAGALFRIPMPALSIALPIGISFYTFQTMSYNIDVYRGTVPPEKNFLTLMTYISMFPQLIAGPIVRYDTIRGEMKMRTVTFDGFSDGMFVFLGGLFKKVLLANTIGELFDAISTAPPGGQSLLTLWLGIFAFYLHIYFDFSGYSDMAIGLGKMLGFSFPQNFNYPMASRTVSDFWRRWHMSLTTWFKDYVYIPLGGSRCSKPKTIRNLLIVWALTGLWHGASWNFLLWGLYFGVILVIEKFVIGRFLSKLPTFLQHLYTTFLVTVGWAIFALEDFHVMLPYLRGMFFNRVLIDDTFLFYLLPYLPIMLCAVVFALPVYPWLREKVGMIEKGKVGNAVVCSSAVILYGALFVLSVALLVANAYNPFLYFRF